MVGISNLEVLKARGNIISPDGQIVIDSVEETTDDGSSQTQDQQGSGSDDFLKNPYIKSSKLNSNYPKISEIL